MVSRGFPLFDDHIERPSDLRGCMKILHVIWSMAVAEGGPPVALVGMAQAQRRAGLDAVVATTFASEEAGPFVASLRESGVDVLSIGPCSGALLRHSALAGQLQ